MKKVVIILLITLSSVVALSNPIAEFLYSEFLFDSTGWKLEIIINHPSLFTERRAIISSSSDSAFFKNNLNITQPIFILTTDSLEKQMQFDPSGDTISIGFLNNDQEIDWYYQFNYGKESDIPCPKSGQSLCFDENNYRCYLDNSPTIGYENDFVGAYGKIKGIVVDPYNIPINDVDIACLYPEFASTRTNSTGQYELENISFNWAFKVAKDGYISDTLFQQIWPDSTIELNIVLQPDPEYFKSFFPLQVGNVWKYSQLYSSFSYTVSVDSVITIGDYQYYKITENNHEKYLRYDSRGNVLIYQNGADTSFYFLSLSTQDSIQLTTGEFPVFINVSQIDSMSFSIGSFDNILTQYFWVEGVFDDEVELYFAQNIGLIEKIVWDHPPVQYQLYYAKVNGVEYKSSGIKTVPGQPEKYALKLNNYPNPFNSSTILRYHLSETDDVRLSVFDLSGRLVEELFSGRQSAGDYHYLWSGRYLPSGIYFISLQAGDQRIIQKCMLMK